MLGQLQLVENPGDHRFTVGAGGVRWQPELCGITEGPPEGQLPMDDVVLRDHADTRAQYRVLGVHAASVEFDDAFRGAFRTGDDLGDGGLSRSGGSDHRGETAGSRREGDILEQSPTTFDGESDAVDT